LKQIKPDPEEAKSYASFAGKREEDIADKSDCTSMTGSVTASMLIRDANLQRASKMEKLANLFVANEEKSDMDNMS
jgi:hypothetical protein